MSFDNLSCRLRDAPSRTRDSTRLYLICAGKIQGRWRNPFISRPDVSCVCTYAFGWKARRGVSARMNFSMPEGNPLKTVPKFPVGTSRARSECRKCCGGIAFSVTRLARWPGKHITSYGMSLYYFFAFLSDSGSGSFNIHLTWNAIVLLSGDGRDQYEIFDVLVFGIGSGSTKALLAAEISEDLHFHVIC